MATGAPESQYRRSACAEKDQEVANEPEHGLRLRRGRRWVVRDTEWEAVDEPFMVVPCKSEVVRSIYKQAWNYNEPNGCNCDKQG